MAYDKSTTNENAPRKRQEKALSAAFVRTASKPGKYFDGHGLFLKVDTSGARRWVQRIVIRGKRTEIGLGSASLVSLGEGRFVWRIVPKGHDTFAALGRLPVSLPCSNGRHCDTCPTLHSTDRPDRTALQLL